MSREYSAPSSSVSTDDALKLENQLCFPLYAASKEIIRLYKPFLGPLNLTYTQYITMLALWEEDDIPVKALGERLHLDSGTLTPLLKKLEIQGRIKRVRKPNDERNVYIQLTDGGIALKSKAAKVPQSMTHCVPLNADEAKTLYTLLYRILNSDQTCD